MGLFYWMMAGKIVLHSINNFTDILKFKHNLWLIKQLLIISNFHFSLEKRLELGNSKA